MDYGWLQDNITKRENIIAWILFPVRRVHISLHKGTPLPGIWVELLHGDVSGGSGKCLDHSRAFWDCCNSAIVILNAVSRFQTPSSPQYCGSSLKTIHPEAPRRTFGNLVTSEPVTDVTDAEEIHSEAMDGNELGGGGVCGNLELQPQVWRFPIVSVLRRIKEQCCNMMSGLIFIFLRSAHMPNCKLAGNVNSTDSRSLDVSHSTHT